MKRTRQPDSTLIVFLIATTLAACDSGTPKVKSVNDRMMEIVTPASNTIWAADPQTDDDWQALDAAASEVISAFQSIKEGGSGESDADWASQVDWDEWSDEVIAAANVARLAVAQRDVDMVFEAGDLLYPPCENCHNKYHPGVVGQ